ncbi:MAG: hypothetical protein HPY61_09690 [Methanotrichaceae archaeon]|nr:hypothetical protein [Methanotrichaceae archaeon]
MKRIVVALATFVVLALAGLQAATACCNPDMPVLPEISCAMPEIPVAPMGVCCPNEPLLPEMDCGLPEIPVAPMGVCCPNEPLSPRDGLRFARNSGSSDGRLLSE